MEMEVHEKLNRQKHHTAELQKLCTRLVSSIASSTCNIQQLSQMMRNSEHFFTAGKNLSGIQSRLSVVNDSEISNIHELCAKRAATLVDRASMGKITGKLGFLERDFSLPAGFFAVHNLTRLSGQRALNFRLGRISLRNFPLLQEQLRFFSRYFVG